MVGATTFPVYVIAVGSILSWVLFIAFPATSASPRFPSTSSSPSSEAKEDIARSEYILAGSAEQTKAVMADAREVQREERGTGKTRKTRRALAEINKRLVQLEEDELILQKMYPQGGDEASWKVTVMGYYASLGGDVVCGIVSILWMLHIRLCMFPDPPLTPFLNRFFVDLDSAFGLLGTGSFALFCFYLIMCVIKGNVKVQVQAVAVDGVPDAAGNTLMSAFLFNVNLIMLSSIAVIQFCAKAFDGYAETRWLDILIGRLKTCGGSERFPRERLSVHLLRRGVSIGDRAGIGRGQGGASAAAEPRVDVIDVIKKRNFYLRGGYEWRHHGKGLPGPASSSQYVSDAGALLHKNFFPWIVEFAVFINPPQWYRASGEQRCCRRVPLRES